MKKNRCLSGHATGNIFCPLLLSSLHGGGRLVLHGDGRLLPGDGGGRGVCLRNAPGPGGHGDKRQKRTWRRILSKKRVMETGFWKSVRVRELSETDYETLLRIVEAEAEGEDENGKLLVANVVLNRVDSPLFPDTVREVVYQQDYGVYQFSPRKGRPHRAGDGKRRNQEGGGAGCIRRGYFPAVRCISRPEAKPPEKSMRWFDSSLTWLFAYGGHEFYG